MTIVLTFATWFVAVYAWRLVFKGSPARTLIRSTPQPVLVEAMACLEEAAVPDDEDSYHFLRQFFWLKLLRASVFLTEGVVLISFLITDPTMIVPWVLVAKNLVIYQVLYHVHYRRHDDPVEAMRHSPPWAERLDRLSQLLTGAGFLLLFLHVTSVL